VESVQTRRCLVVDWHCPTVGADLWHLHLVLLLPVLIVGTLLAIVDVGDGCLVF
jgi:hypothetical protein